jgi:hypothetical protein
MLPKGNHFQFPKLEEWRENGKNYLHSVIFSGLFEFSCKKFDCGIDEATTLHLSPNPAAPIGKNSRNEISSSYSS